MDNDYSDQAASHEEDGALVQPAADNTSATITADPLRTWIPVWKLCCVKATMPFEACAEAKRSRARLCALIRMKSWSMSA